MMLDIFLQLGAISLLLILGVLMIVPVERQLRSEFNPVNQKFKRLLVLLVLFTFISWFIPWFHETAFNISEPILGKALKISYITGFLVVVIQFAFLLLIFEYRKLYPIPVIWIFYTILGLYEQESTLHVAISSMLISSVLIGFFMYKGIKNRDGRIFSFGLYVIIYTMDQFFFRSLFVEGFISPGNIIGFFILNLGLWGVFDKYLFYDREREEQIKNAWIAKMIVEDKSTEINMIGPTYMRVECPACHARGKVFLETEVVEARLKDPKGIVRIPIHAGEVCEHELIAYVDRKFKVRGYESACEPVEVASV